MDTGGGICKMYRKSGNDRVINCEPSPHEFLSFRLSIHVISVSFPSKQQCGRGVDKINRVRVWLDNFCAFYNLGFYAEMLYFGATYGIHLLLQELVLSCEYSR